MTIEPVDLAEVLPLLSQAGGPRTDTTAGTATVGELCEGGQAYSLDVDGQRVGAYCLKAVDHLGARVVWIAAAAAKLDGVDLTAAIVPAIEAQAALADADQVAITTRRSGLILKLQAQGYEVTGVTLRKNL